MNVFNRKVGYNKHQPEVEIKFPLKDIDEHKVLLSKSNKYQIEK